MKRDVDYHWHLAELMARRGLHNSTELAPLLRERGIELSPSQVYRLVTGRPERVSLKVVAALCDVFECGIDDLITTTAADAKKTRRTGTSGAGGSGSTNVVAMNELLPCAPGSSMTPDPSAAPPRRGRPRTSGGAHCDRCGRSAGKLRSRWPEGGIRGTCFHAAVRTTGTCPSCGHHGMLPGLNDDQPICRSCAGIPTDLDCHRCGTEAEHYRRGGICARCALRDDLAVLLSPAGPPPPALARLLELLVGVDRPESVHTWKRRPAVQRCSPGSATGAST